MKLFPTMTAFAFVLALSFPAFALDKKEDAADQNPAASLPMDDGQPASDDGIAGPVADIPRNQIQCSDDGGTWDDQSNTCKDVGS
jgi:hypothetical protein